MTIENPQQSNNSNEFTKELEEIASARPEIKEYNSGSQVEVTIRLPHNNYIKAAINNERANIEYFLVQPELRKKGIGDRLLKCLIINLIKRGVKILAGSLESEESLRKRLKIFGKDNVNLHPDFAIYGNKAADSYRSVEQAIENLRKGEYVECDSDLMKIDTSNWDMVD